MNERYIYKNLRKIRKIFKMTQSKMAEITEINEKYYGRLERNESIPSVTMLNKISKGLEIEIPIIFYENFENMTDIKILNIILRGLKKNIGININRDNILNECENIIWYNGFLGSIIIDEFELKIYAYGKIKGKLYINYQEKLDLNQKDVSNKLKKYIKNDKELQKLIVYMNYDKRIFSKKKGNVFFLENTNSIVIKCFNNNLKNGENEIFEEILDDKDNVMEIFSDIDMLLNFYFEMKK